MGRRVAFLAINPWDRPGSYQPFSFGAYRVSAAAAQHPSVDEVRVFDSNGWSVEQFHQELEAFDPDVIGASAYVWSLLLFTDLLARLRKGRPDRMIILGGPSARPEMLDLAPYASLKQVVDAVVLSDGEPAFGPLLDRFGQGRDALLSVPGLALPRGLWRRTAPRELLQDLDVLPSPFQNGLVPAGKSAHLETFRGCPLSCAFCEWGTPNSANATFSADYLERELRAFQQAGCKYVHQVDAGINLNSRAFRNLLEADNRVGYLDQVEFNCEVYPSLLTSEQIEFLHRTRARVGIGLQSYNKDVLDAVERPFHPAKFEHCIRQLTSHCHTTASLILGLPGDNPRSFRETLARALDLPCNLRVHYCLVLPDALMSRSKPEWNIEFDPYSLQLLSCEGWSRKDLEREREHLSLQAEKHNGVAAIQPMFNNTGTQVAEYGDGYAGLSSTYWYFPLQENKQFRLHTSDGPRTRPAMPWSEEALARGVAATGGAWKLRGEGSRGAEHYASFETPAGEVNIIAEPVREGRRYFLAHKGLAFSYSTFDRGQLQGSVLSQCDALIRTLAREV